VVSSTRVELTTEVRMVGFDAEPESISIRGADA